MKITLTPYDIKSLSKTDSGWEYTISTFNGNKITGSEIYSEKEAVKHCENNIQCIIRKMIEK